MNHETKQRENSWRRMVGPLLPGRIPCDKPTGPCGQSFLQVLDIQPGEYVAMPRTTVAVVALADQSSVLTGRENPQIMATSGRHAVKRAALEETKPSHAHSLSLSPTCSMQHCQMRSQGTAYHEQTTET